MMTDQDFLKEAIRVGNLQEKPRNFGALIVRKDEIIAADYNHVRENNDPTAHAETSAMRAACQKLGTYSLEGATMYGSHEPCLMCFSCAAWANIGRVVFSQPASEVNDFTYEFERIRLQDIAGSLTRRDISVELIRIDQ